MRSAAENPLIVAVFHIGWWPGNFQKKFAKKFDILINLGIHKEHLTRLGIDKENQNVL